MVDAPSAASMLGGRVQRMQKHAGIDLARSFSVSKTDCDPSSPTILAPCRPCLRIRARAASESASANGLTVSKVPEERKVVKIDGEDYFEYNGVTYRGSFRDGKIVYRVVLPSGESRVG